MLYTEGTSKNRNLDKFGARFLELTKKTIFEDNIVDAVSSKNRDAEEG
jgi:hypothetical protein